MSKADLVRRVVCLLERNWLYIDVLMRANLREILTKNEQITILREALELMEAANLDTVQRR